MKLLKLLIVALSVMFFSVAHAGDKVKVGFIYVGPTGDHGWTYRHDIGRQDVEKHFGDKVETTFIESVKYGPDAERAIRAMAKSGADIIFATSFGYMEPMLKVAKEFPNVKFEHATGYKQSKNMSSYGLRLYQARHVQGVIAGMMTKTNKICYVGAFPIPEVIREINTYYLGAKSVNPDVDIDIIWVNTWYNPGREADAAKVMIAEGCDMVAQHTDSPAPLQTAEKAGVFGFGQASNQYKFAPKAQLTATIDNWSPYYIQKYKQ
jgi:basic membrane protein A